MTTKPNYISALDGVRFCAAFLVLVTHLAHIIHNTEPNGYGNWVANLAQIGMSLFFILSGFVIHYNYHTLSHRHYSDIRSFLVARFSRLYPLYAAVFIMVLLIGRNLPENLSLSEIATFLTGTQSWRYGMNESNSLVYRMGGWMSVTWSISTEFFFYIFYIVAARYVVKIRSNLQHLIVAGVIFFVYLCFFGSIYFNIDFINQWASNHYGNLAQTSGSLDDSFVRWLIYFSPYSRLLEFLFGCLIANRILQKTSNLPQNNNNGRVVVISAFIIIAYSLIVSQKNEFLAYNSTFLIAPLIAYWIFLIASHDSLISRFFAHNIMRWFGSISYSVYMLHGVCLLVALKLVSYIPLPPQFHSPISYIITAGIIVIVSAASFYMLEKPAKKLIRKLSKTT